MCCHVGGLRVSSWPFTYFSHYDLYFQIVYSYIVSSYLDGKKCGSICIMTSPFDKYYVHTFQILAPYFADAAEITHCKF